MTRALWAGVATALVVSVSLAVQIAGAQAPSTAAGVDVVLVLDQSGSMKQNDPQRLMIQAVREAVGKLGPRDAAGVVVFGGQARAIHPLAPLATEGIRESIPAELDRIRYGDPRTNISAGIERGLYELKEHGRAGAGPILIFITDGIMDTGSSAKDAEMREWLRAQLLPEARQRAVRLFSIALTEQADFPLIQEMASATGGDYYRALTAQEIAPIFDKILARIEQRRAAAPSSPIAPSVPGTALGTAPTLATAWLWIVGAAVLAVLLLGGMIMARRLRPATAPAARGIPDRTVASVSLAPPAPAQTPIPSASLRDLRTRKAAPLTKPLMRIGRKPDNDIVIPERQVSGHHAEIECRQGHFYLRDLRSTNGTWINKQRVEVETMLKSGDVIGFDQFTYTFSGPDLVGGGTMMREVSEGTLVIEPPPARPAAPAASQTAIVDMNVTVDDSVGPAHCPAHASFEATERCDRCGHLWCALCNPPVAGERVCRRCRETGAGQAKRPVPHSGGRR